MNQPSLAEFENELKRDPRSRKFYDLAREYQKLGRLAEARDICEKGLLFHPSQWQARIFLAQIYVTQGNLEEGRQMVERVLLALPDSVPANHLAADIYKALGQTDKALRHYQIVELLDPGRSGVREYLSEIQQPPPVDEPPAPAHSPPSDSSPRPTPELLEEAVGAPPVPPPNPDTGGVVSPSPDPSHWEPPPVVSDEPATAHAAISEERFTLDSEFPLEGSEETASFAEILEPSAAEATEGLQVPDSPLLATEGEPLESGASELSDQPLFAEEAVSESSGAEGFVGMNTFTLAELYERQGYPEKAVEIYQRMLLQDPENEEIHGRIRTLKQCIAGDAPEAPAVHQEDVDKALRQKRVMVLQDWLRRVREDRHV